MWTPPTPEEFEAYKAQRRQEHLLGQGFDARTFSGSAQVFRCLYQKKTSYTGYKYSQFLSPNLDCLPVGRVREVLQGPLAVLSNDRFTVTSDVGPVVLGTRHVDISGRPDYLKRTVHPRRKVKALPTGITRREIPGPFSLTGQRMNLGLESSIFGLYGARAAWRTDSNAAVEEFYVLLAGNEDEAASAAAEFSMQRSGLAWNEFTLEIERTYLSYINDTTPVMVLNRTSKLNWDEYISDQLLPPPLSFIEYRLPMTEAREWLVDGKVNDVAALAQSAER